MISEVLGFWVIALMLTAYTLLDGYDLGAGAISLALARTRPERSAIVEAIGPFWSGNEVWLVAAGGTLFAFFPKVYAVSFSGFYLPFIIVLWLLMFRGVAIELRDKVPGTVWMDFWDTAFAASSFLLLLLLGVALGNLVRGLPLGPDGYFLGTLSGLLNPYALAVGALAVCALVGHGLAYIADNLKGDLGDRASQFIGWTWWCTLAIYLAVTVATVLHHRGSSTIAPLAPIAAVIALLSLFGLSYAAARRQYALTLRASFVFLAALLAAAATTMYPYLIRSYPRLTGGLTIFNASSPPAALAVSLGVALIGLALVAAYSVAVHRWMRTDAKA
jgi:cytochrome d ubiquinol oxidase subunit II